MCGLLSLDQCFRIEFAKLVRFRLAAVVKLHTTVEGLLALAVAVFESAALNKPCLLQSTPKQDLILTHSKN